MGTGFGDRALRGAYTDIRVERDDITTRILYSGLTTSWTSSGEMKIEGIPSILRNHRKSEILQLLWSLKVACVYQ